jgi:hypothetical protein
MTLDGQMFLDDGNLFKPIYYKKEEWFLTRLL